MFSYNYTRKVSLKGENMKKALTLSELITKLEAMKAECGNLNVVISSRSEDDDWEISNDKIFYVKENWKGMLFDESKQHFDYGKREKVVVI